MLNIGPPELILIFVIALVIVGPQRLPEMGRTIGTWLREFRKMQDEVKDMVNTGMGEELRSAASDLKRSAADLKSATDVRSAFKSDTQRPPRHAVAADTPEDPAPAPDAPAEPNAPPGPTSPDDPPEHATA